MYPSKYGRGSRILVAGAAAVTLVGVLLVVGQTTLRPRAGNASERSPAIAGLLHGPALTTAPTVTGTTYRAPRVAPAQSAEQTQVDTELAQAERQTSITPAQAAALPAGADTAQYPAVPVGDRNDPGAYATAFVAELINRDYTRQSREELLDWAQAESAPNTLPGVPAAVASRSLLLSLMNPAGQAGPVPSPQGWAADASSRVSQSVSGLQEQVNPDWLSLISTGWEPVDPAMTILTVTGTLVTHVLATHGPSESDSQSFSVVVTLGSNGARPGYGAVAVDDWTLG
jgi:hypothetical protein